MITKESFKLLQETCAEEEDILQRIADNISTMSEADLLTKLKEHNSLRKISVPILDEIKKDAISGLYQDGLKELETKLKNIQSLNKTIAQKAHNKKSLIKNELSTVQVSRNALSGYAAPNKSHPKKATGRLLKISG